jgi:hypothetical protein
VAEKEFTAFHKPLVLPCLLSHLVVEKELTAFHKLLERKLPLEGC